MAVHTTSNGFEERLLTELRRNFLVLGPVRGSDGVCRLAPVQRWADLTPAALPLIPLKKTLLPPRDTLWAFDADGYREPPPTATALVAIPACDLYALAYLDQVFADDPLYQRRRRDLLLVGAECEAGPGCFCPPRTEPPPFDLFLAGGRAWAGTVRGEELLVSLEMAPAPGEDVPLPKASGPMLPDPEALERLFAESAALPLWRQVADRCVSCGACSAVCPTCYCYDVVDEALPGGRVTRLREWDNCFFRSHALVAGGQSFRPTRTQRLRFRFEHKLLGFGPLRGIPSCVGCGRCGRACPVDIDISEVLAALVAGEGA